MTPNDPTMVALAREPTPAACESLASFGTRSTMRRMVLSMSHMIKPERLLGVTIGDPAGVGPELVVRCLATDEHGDDDVIVCGDPPLLERTAARLGVRPPRHIEAVTSLAAADIAPSSAAGG